MLLSHFTIALFAGNTTFCPEHVCVFNDHESLVVDTHGYPLGSTAPGKIAQGVRTPLHPGVPGTAAAVERKICPRRGRNDLPGRWIILAVNSVPNGQCLPGSLPRVHVQPVLCGTLLSFGGQGLDHAIPARKLPGMCCPLTPMDTIMSQSSALRGSLYLVRFRHSDNSFHHPPTSRPLQTVNPPGQHTSRDSRGLNFNHRHFASGPSCLTAGPLPPSRSLVLVLISSLRLRPSTIAF